VSVGEDTGRAVRPMAAAGLSAVGEETRSAGLHGSEVSCHFELLN
jgi:hypothetical protein